MISVKKISLLTFLMVCLSLHLLAYNGEVVFTGRVTSLQQQNTVAFYRVVIRKGDDSLNTVYAITDENGVYSQKIVIEPDETVIVSVTDCEGAEKYQVFNAPDSINVADFSICFSYVDCYAMYMEQPDSTNPLAHYFYNFSEGYYNLIVWDFGDNTTSNEENPYHVFPDEGAFTVSLTIADTLSPTGCFDIYSQEIIVGGQHDCSADFSFLLDTLNITPNVYRFSNLSIGDSLNYYWDFDDGYSSVEESPVHVYQEGGNYEVTLSVHDVSGFCYDEITKEVVTPEYFNFGGQAFLGDYPINIDPDDNSNVAVANLYRKMEGRWHFVDKREFWQLGYYWFVDKLEGDYLIEVGLNNESADYNNYAPGYFMHAAKWQDASTFTLDSEAFEESVNLTPLAPLDNGIYKISGYVVFDSSRTGTVTDTLSEVLVQLFNQEGNMVKYTYSNQLGGYEFDNLPEGTYSVRGEVVGICSSKSTVNLSDDNPFENDIRVTVFDCGNIGVDENPAPNHQISAVMYPVPAKNTITISLSSAFISKIKIDIYNIQGVRMEYREFLLSGNENPEIDISKWPNGIYLVNILNNNNEKLLGKKIIISH